MNEREKRNKQKGQKGSAYRLNVCHGYDVQESVFMVVMKGLGNDEE